MKYNSKANAGEILKFNGVAVLDQDGREIVCRGMYLNHSFQVMKGKGRGRTRKESEQNVRTGD